MPRFDDASLTRLRELFAKRPAIEIDAPQVRRACVLIPILPSDRGWSLLFSRRSANLAAHSGQIAFPGGAVEEGESLEEAVKREADEEVGIPRESVQLIGRLDDVITNSGFLVAPFAGIIHERVEYVLQESEVDEVFEVPLDELLVPEMPHVRYVTFRNKRYPVYSYPFGANDIWGLTGRIVKAFLDVAWMAKTGGQV
ncbi:MAG: CoA pyrophosphatase [Acidobacteria bacterium]|nr:CoA pyrophosphatase [Acidobacteriota bacterium]